MLSEPSVIKALNQDYVNSWVLFQDLVKVLQIHVNASPGIEYLNAVKSEAEKRISTGTEYQRFCAKLLAGYHYPVDTHVFARDGSFVGNCYAGDIMSDPKIFDKFEALLKKGAQR